MKWTTIPAVAVLATALSLTTTAFAGPNDYMFEPVKAEVNKGDDVIVAVGFIALAGVAAETGVVMLIYLEHAYAELQEQRATQGQPFTRDDLYAAIMSGAVERVRPKMMTVCAIMAGLLPIMWSHGTGAEVMQRIAVPMIGGMVSSTLLTLIVIPAIYAVLKGALLRSPRLAPSLQQT
jgi:Cu(I)/Ag(I) efflux system membrane protein CusA/SilA